MVFPSIKVKKEVLPTVQLFKNSKCFFPVSLIILFIKNISKILK